MNFIISALRDRNDSDRIEELTRLLQDPKNSPAAAFKYVEDQKPGYYLSTDMRDQASRLDIT